MKQIIETATDAAMVCFFDPAALPADFDAKAKDDPFDAVYALSQEGRVWLQESGGDGSYLFHFYVDEPVPDKLLKNLQDREEISKFSVPSGCVWACGVEYAAKDPVTGNEMTPRGGLGKFGHMGGHFELPNGDYAVTAWRAEWADSEIANALRNPPGGKPLPSVKTLGLLTGLLFVASLIGTVFWVPVTMRALQGRVMSSGVAWSWALLVVSWGLCIYFMKKFNRAANDPAREAVEREFPDIVVQMRRLG